MLRKKELLELPELIPEVSGLCASAEVVELGGKEILHIDVFDFDQMVVRYFADRKNGNWICFGKKAGWNKMGLSSAVDYELSSGSYYNYGGYRAYCITSKVSFDSSAQEVIGYLVDHTEYWGHDAIGMIGHWEYQQNAKKRDRYMTNKEMRIAELMGRVPAVPDDFENWLSHEIFPEDYLFIRRAGKNTEYTCTACGKQGARKIKAKVGDTTACPRCRKQVEVRSLNRKYKPKKANIVIMQKMRVPRDRKDFLRKICPEQDGYVERQLTVYCRPWNGKKNYTIYEDLRAIVPEKQTWGKVYYGEYNDTGPEDQCFWDKNHYSRRWKTSYLYPGGLREVLETAGMEHSGLDILARDKVLINVDYFIISYHNMEWVEYLIKAGLYRLVQDIVDRNRRVQINSSGTSLQECLSLNGAGISRMKQLNGGAYTLEWLKVEHKTGKKISKESLQFFTEQQVSPWGSTSAEMYRLFASPNKMANYIRSQMEKTGYAASTILQTWYDYIDMCKRLKKQIGNEMVYRPKNVRLAHDECLALLKREDAGKRAGEVRKKFPEAEINMQMMADKYEFSDDTYTIIVPETIEDIIVEGATLGHCIDRTDVYFDRIQRRTSFLVFLRMTERPDAPWYTLEIEPGGTIRQKRTVGNTQKDADIKAFTPFLREWQKHVLRKMNETDKALARASKEARIAEYGQLREKKEPIRRGLLAGQLLVDVLEADLMEAM